MRTILYVKSMLCGRCKTVFGRILRNVAIRPVHYCDNQFALNLGVIKYTVNMSGHCEIKL